MTEKEAMYVTKQDIDDANAMLGGYEVYPPQEVLEMQSNYESAIKTKPAWIKISTDFKGVMSTLKGAKGWVFIAISLYINKNFECFPSVDTIAETTGHSRKTVISAIKELEQLGFLTVTKGVKRSNLYKINGFAAYGKGNTPNGNKITPQDEITPQQCNLDAENIEKWTQITPEVESLRRTNKKNSLEGEIFSSENQKTRQEAASLLDDLRKRKAPTEQKPKTEKQPLPMDWQILAGGKITGENQAASLGESLGDRLIGWRNVRNVSGTHISLLKQFCESFGVMPPKARNKKNQSSTFYAWLAGLDALIENAEGKDTVRIVRELGREIDDDTKAEFYRTPYSLRNKVLSKATATTPPSRSRVVMDNDGMIVSARA